MKYKILFILLMITTILLGNSIFSFDGLPLKYYGNDVYGMGMGDTGSADLFRINPNFSNPSLSVSTNNVMFATGVSLGYVWYQDNIGQEYRDDGLDLPYFSIAVPIKNHRFAFSYNLVASGNIENEIDMFHEAFQDTLEYTNVNRLNSNIFKAKILYALKNKFVNFGISGDYYLGNRIRYWEIDFEDSDIEDAQYEIEKLFKKPGFSIGLSKRLGSVSLGASYSSAVKLTGTAKYKYNHYPYTDTLEISDDYLLEVPAEISVGLTYKFLEKYKTSLDVHHALWEKTDSFTKNTSKLGLGFAYDPLSGYGSWFNRIPLRFGGYIRELQFERNNNAIWEKAVTCGLSIPFRSPDKKIELSVEYLTRGNLDEHLLQDDSLKFSFGVTGFDIFKKRPKRTAPRDIPEPDKQMVR